MAERTRWAAGWALTSTWLHRLAVPAGWVVIVPMVLLALTQVIGLTSWRLLAVLHALTPYLLVPAVPLAVIAMWSRRWALGATATAVVLVLATLSWPLFFPPAQPSAAAAAPALRITHSNVLYENTRLDDAVAMLLARDDDVLVVTEFSRRVQAEFHASPLAARFPYRIEHPSGAAGGTAIWSRHPLARQPPPTTKFATVIADVTLPDDSTVRIVGVHPPTPTHDFEKWRDELDDLGRYAATDVPTMVTGDFNASWWHPGFRDLLAAGFRDAHQARGAGFSVSWPTNGSVPPFVRLDHALLTDALVVDAVRDFDVPGSDHRAFTVTVRRAAADPG